MNQLVDIDQSASMRVGSVFKANNEQTLNGGNLDLEGRTFLAGDIADANSNFHSNLIEEDLVEDQQEHEMSA